MSKNKDRKTNQMRDMEGFFRIYSNGVKIVEFKDSLVKSKRELDKFLKEKMGLNGSQ